MTQNDHVYAICCRCEVDGDVVSGQNVNATVGFVVVNLGIANSSYFRDIPKQKAQQLVGLGKTPRH